MAKDALEDFSGAIGDYTLVAGSSRPTSRACSAVAAGRIWPTNAFQPAVHDFDEAIRLAPTNADAYTGRGLARARLGLHRDAVSDADEALELDDSSWRIAYNAARIYAQAAVAADSESRKTGPVAVRLISRYQDRAFELVRAGTATGSRRAPIRHPSARRFRPTRRCNRSGGR